MTAVEIATGIIDKLQEENRVGLEALHKAQDTIQDYKRQIAEKDRVIKVLEERIRHGTDGILEMTNRQKDLTIKHLEMQIQNLLKEKEDLEVRLEAVKSEICPKCETKLLLYDENRGSSKSYRPPGKSSSALLGRKSSQTVCPNRVKALERINEHKDRRIMHLSKEVQRLNKTEKELTQKIYRLTKLLPMSRLPSNTITDCLLSEIQLLESQNQLDEDGPSVPPTLDALGKVKKPLTTSNKTNLLKSSTFPKSETTKLNVLESKQADTLDATKYENEVLFNKLKKLCHDITELKHLFTNESAKLSHGLSSSASEFRSFKLNLEDIINNLNEIVQNILDGDFKTDENDHLGFQSDDKYVISCLQDRLKESLGMVTEYENENRALKESIERLKAKTIQHDYLPEYERRSSEKVYKSSSDSKCNISNIYDIKQLREIIRNKEAQLESAQTHISSCEKYIEELQKNRKKSTFEHPQIQHSSSRTVDLTVDNAFEQENKILQTKLNVAEKNIETCENVIEQLQNKLRDLEEKNEKVETELHELKSKAISNKGITTDASFSKSNDARSLKKQNQELQDKIKHLEETIKKIETDRDSEKTKIEVLTEEKAQLQIKLDAADKQIETLQRSIEKQNNKLKNAEEEKNRLEIQLKELIEQHNIAAAYENDVMALKNQLFLKEDENRELKESIHALENKALEMNHYRKALHQEIENLCKVFMESETSDDSECRKTIFQAAVLRSALALLRLDDNFNLKTDDPNGSSALDEFTHQMQVYLTEVSRIHELLTAKEKERNELFKEYLDLDDDAMLRLSSPHLFESRTQGKTASENLRSSASLNVLKSPTSSGSHQISKAVTVENGKLESSVIAFQLKNVQKELDDTKAVTTYLLTSCTRLEELLSRERENSAKCEKEVEVYRETIKDLKAKLKSNDTVTKRLTSLIDMMRTKEFNDDVELSKLQTEIKWLIDRTTATDSALWQYKEENNKMKSDIETLQRELMHEKYEKTKTDHELKRLQMKILNSPSVLDESL